MFKMLNNGSDSKNNKDPKIIDVDIEMKRLAATKFAAVPSLLGRGIASTYLRVIIGPRMARAELNMDNIPKSLGEYSLVIIGVEAIPMMRAIMLPKARVAIPLNILLIGVVFINVFWCFVFLKRRYLRGIGLRAI